MLFLGCEAASFVTAGSSALPLSALSGNSSPVTPRLGQIRNHFLWSFLVGLGPPLTLPRLAMPSPVSTHHLFCWPPPFLSSPCIRQGPALQPVHSLCWDSAGNKCVFFLAQVNELPSSTVHREKLEGKENEQKRPLTAPREAKKTRRKHSMSSKYDGYEELLTAKPDQAFVEPKGMSGPGASPQPRAKVGAALHLNVCQGVS